jgi:hypothetical protein
MNSFAHLSDLDRDCLKLSIEELEKKYPNFTREELLVFKRVISEHMSELGQRRFLKWMSSRSWSDYSKKKP